MFFSPNNIHKGNSEFDFTNAYTIYTEEQINKLGLVKKCTACKDGYSFEKDCKLAFLQSKTQ